MATFSLAATLTGTGSLTANLSNAVRLKATLTGSSALTARATPVQEMAFVLRAGSDLYLKIPAPQTIDPSTGREPYKLVIVDRLGNQIAELENAQIGTVSWALSDFGILNFTMPTEDPKVLECKAPTREVQVWRGTQIIWWGVLVAARGNGASVVFQASSLEWYFSRRVIGEIPIRNRLLNSDFEDGIRFWNLAFEAGSSPASPPVWRIDQNRVLSGRNSLYLKGQSGTVVVQEGTTTTATIAGDVNFATDSSALTAAGRTAIQNVVNQTQGPAPVMTVIGHADSTGSHAYNQSLSERRAASVKAHILTLKPAAQVRAYGMGETQPIATNGTVAGRAANRRVTITYSTITVTAAILAPTGHKQYAWQDTIYNNPTSGARTVDAIAVAWVYVQSYVAGAGGNYGLWLGRWRGARLVQIAVVPIDANTPIGRWIRMEVALEIPPDGEDERIEVRMYPPDGEAFWDRASLTFSDALVFPDTDQATIVEGLVQHAQDVAIGKSDLNIGTNCGRTGVRRTRIYPYIERQPIYEALMDFHNLADGVEMSIEITPKTRTLTTHYPRRGDDRLPVLALGSNILSFDMDVDAGQSSTTVVVQAEGEGSDREEGWAKNPALLDGLVLEIVYNATPGSSVSSLQPQAERGLARYRRQIIVPSITMLPEKTNELFDEIKTGDRVEVDIRRGWLTVLGVYRITVITLDPKTDALSYTIAPEDVVP